MMNQRTFLCGLTLGALAAPLAAEAQQRQVPRIGILSAPRAPSNSPGGAELDPSQATPTNWPPNHWADRTVAGRNFPGVPRSNLKRMNGLRLRPRSIRTVATEMQSLSAHAEVGIQ